MSGTSPLASIQEEADTGLLFHASHAYHSGFKKLIIHATDSDVMIIAFVVSNVLHGCEIWINKQHLVIEQRSVISHVILFQKCSDLI